MVVVSGVAALCIVAWRGVGSNKSRTTYVVMGR
jgi:hypothetical protein